MVTIRMFGFRCVLAFFVPSLRRSRSHSRPLQKFALYNLATSSPEAARTSFVKALAYDLNHIGANVLLARLYLAGAPAKVPYAEGLLDTLTKRYGWDVPEAWFELSRCYKATGRPGREKECLVWALQLEETRSVRALGCLPRLL